MRKMDSVLKVTKGMDSHVSIYVFEKTEKGTEEIRAQLPKEFYVEEYLGEDYAVFRADNFGGFEYVEITVYPREKEE